jgi:hypothetical protein
MLFCGQSPFIQCDDGDADEHNHPKGKVHALAAYACKQKAADETTGRRAESKDHGAKKPLRGGAQAGRSVFVGVGNARHPHDRKGQAIEDLTQRRLASRARMPP